MVLIRPFDFLLMGAIVGSFLIFGGNRVKSEYIAAGRKSPFSSWTVMCGIRNVNGYEIN